MTSPTIATKRLIVAPTRQMSNPTCTRSKNSVSVLATSASYTVKGFVVWPQKLRRLPLYWASFGGLKD